MLNKIWHILITTIKTRKISLLVYFIVSIGMLEILIALFPTFSESAQAIEAAYANLPEGFFAAVGVDALGFSTIEGYLATEQFSFVWPLLVILLNVGVAASLATEIEKGTIELVLSKPVSRITYFLGKYFASISMLILFTAGSTLMIVPFAQLHGVEVNFNNILSMAALGLLFGWAVLSLGFLVSSWLSDKSRVLFITGGALFGMYILNILARLQESLEGLKYLSFFYYFDPQALTSGTIDKTAIAVFIGFSIVATSVALWRWNSRDIPV